MALCLSFNVYVSCWCNAVRMHVSHSQIESHPNATTYPWDRDVVSIVKTFCFVYFLSSFFSTSFFFFLSNPCAFICMHIAKMAHNSNCVAFTDVYVHCAVHRHTPTHRETHFTATRALVLVSWLQIAHECVHFENMIQCAVEKYRIGRPMRCRNFAN